LNDEACEIARSTKTEDRMDVLLQVEMLQLQYQFDEMNAAKNSAQLKYKMKKSVEV
jgi:hypothetical protein